MLSFLAFGQKANAASLSLTPSNYSPNVGDTFTVSVFVSTTSDKAINAISGKISYPADKLSIVSLSKANSIVNVWTTEPVKEGDTVHYEGIVLNPGYNGTKGKITTITFKAKTSGVANLNFSSASVLANDGFGTNVLDKTGTVNITIKKAPSTIVATPIKTPAKTPVVNLPEPIFTITPVPTLVEIELPYKKFNFTVSNTITPIISYNISIDKGSFVIWNDDGTGIYTTPELLSGEHTLTVEAIDNDGNKLINSANFKIATLLKPVIKMSGQVLRDGDFLVISGNASPNENVNIFIKSQLDNSDNIYNTLLGKTSYVAGDFEQAGTVLADKNGLFTFVNNDRIKHGIYSIYAISKTDNNIESKPSETVVISIQRNMYQKIITFVFRGLVFFLLPLIGLLTILKLITAFFSKIYNIFKRHKENSIQEINKTNI